MCYLLSKVSNHPRESCFILSLKLCFSHSALLPSVKNLGFTHGTYHYGDRVQFWSSEEAGWSRDLGWPNVQSNLQFQHLQRRNSTYLPRPSKSSLGKCLAHRVCSLCNHSIIFSIPVAPHQLEIQCLEDSTSLYFYTSSLFSHRKWVH